MKNRHNVGYMDGQLNIHTGIGLHADSLKPVYDLLQL